MRAQEDHAVDKSERDQLPGKVASDKHEKGDRQGRRYDPAPQGEPSFPRLEDIESGEKLSKKLRSRWFIKDSVARKSIRRWLKYPMQEGQWDSPVCKYFVKAKNSVAGKEKFTSQL